MWYIWFQTAVSDAALKIIHDDGFNDDVINYDIAIISYLLAKTMLDLISKLAHNV